MFWNKTKKLLQESILLAIDSIREDIQNTADQDENLTRAEAIKKLTEAFKNVS